VPSLTEPISPDSSDTGVRVVDRQRLAVAIGHAPEEAADDAGRPNTNVIKSVRRVKVIVRSGLRTDVAAARPGPDSSPSRPHERDAAPVVLIDARLALKTGYVLVHQHDEFVGPLAVAAEMADVIPALCELLRAHEGEVRATTGDGEIDEAVMQGSGHVGGVAPVQLAASNTPAQKLATNADLDRASASRSTTTTIVVVSATAALGAFVLGRARGRRRVES